MRVEPDGRQALPRVVVVGGGFAGLYAASSLARRAVRVTVVDRENYHLFQPLLYQVATAALSPGEIAEPIRAILRRHRNVDVLLGEVTAVDLASRTLVLVDRTLSYDYLVLATGASHSYFGHPEWERMAPGLKTLEEALEMRRRILFAFEAAEREPDHAARAACSPSWSSAAAQPLAGAIAEIRRLTVAHDFRSIDPTTAKVILLEGAPRVLPPFRRTCHPRPTSSCARSASKCGPELW